MTPTAMPPGVVKEEWTTGEGWQPIQSGEAWIVAENPFAATFDGNGHTISNLYINRRTDDPEDYAPVGLFGSTTPDSVIRNVGLVDVNVAGLAPVGGLLGQSRRNLGQPRRWKSVGGRLRRRAGRFHRLHLGDQRQPLLWHRGRPGNRWGTLSATSCSKATSGTSPGTYGLHGLSASMLSCWNCISTRMRRDQQC